MVNPLFDPSTITQIKQYRLVRELGRGAMGTVYEGLDARDGSRVAVKVLKPELVAADPTFRDRFEREAHVAALLRSPYTVHLNDFGFANGLYFLVMEYVEGESLNHALEAGAMDPARALHVAIAVARALEEAAARGVVHRDIKPDNILLAEDGVVKVADFGIARQEGSAGATIVGGYVGTPAYSAPEQTKGDVDTRTDIYALGATLYCMLVGHPPYTGNSSREILQQHQYAPVPMAPLAGLPDSITNPIRRCLEKDPRDRYQTPSELAGALERAARALAVAAIQGSPATPVPPAPRPTSADTGAIGAATAGTGSGSAPGTGSGSAPGAGAAATPAETGPAPAETGSQTDDEDSKAGALPALGAAAALGGAAAAGLGGAAAAGLTAEPTLAPVAPAPTLAPIPPAPTMPPLVSTPAKTEVAAGSAAAGPAGTVVAAPLAAAAVGGAAGAAGNAGPPPAAGVLAGAGATGAGGAPPRKRRGLMLATLGGGGAIVAGLAVGLSLALGGGGGSSKAGADATATPTTNAVASASPSPGTSPSPGASPSPDVSPSPGVSPSPTTPGATPQPGQPTPVPVIPPTPVPGQPTPIPPTPIPPTPIPPTPVPPTPTPKPVVVLSFLGFWAAIQGDSQPSGNTYFAIPAGVTLQGGGSTANRCQVTGIYAYTHSDNAAWQSPNSVTIDYSWYLDGSFLASGSWTVSADPTWFGWRSTPLSAQTPLTPGTYKLLLSVEGTNISYSEAFTLRNC